MMRWAAVALVAATLGVGAVGCGGDDDGGSADTTATETTTEETTGTTSTAAGKEIFVANCGSCHTLSDAGTTGNIGPNLDELDVSTSDVENQVTNGGGGMPAFGDQLSSEEIQEVAAYVVAARGG
jgi:mono/diheme cytochrome c family protein